MLQLSICRVLADAQCREIRKEWVGKEGREVKKRALQGIDFGKQVLHRHDTLRVRKQEENNVKIGSLRKLRQLIVYGRIVIVDGDGIAHTKSVGAIAGEGLILHVLLGQQIDRCHSIE